MELKCHFVSIVLILGLCGCNNKKHKILYVEQINNAGTDSIKGNPKACVNPHSRLGDKMYYSISSENETELDVKGKTEEVKNKTDISWVYQVIKDTANEYVLKIKFDKIHIYTKKRDEELDIDASNSENSINPTERILGIFKAVPLYATINAKGKIIKLEGYNSIYDSILVVLGGGVKSAEKEAVALKEKLSKLLGEDFIKNSMEQGKSILPAKNVEVGDNWEVNENQSITGLPMGLKTIYTLESLEDGQAVITSKTEIQNDSINLKSMVGFQVNASLKGDETGKYTIQPSTGIVINAEGSASLKGSIQTIGQEIPIKIKFKKTMLSKKI
ncbi:DUF6263 family protein [Parasediminibacterium sp. JCM 36343]|uniref:DUF6263 family protein n=1 Tax=Parasediminibacterium sp. JCM 36343 TaxID=3374279 RepID=UPI00397BB7EA